MKKLIFSLLVFFFLAPAGSKAGFELGTHYLELAVAEAGTTGDTIEVREFFWYGCPHCYRLEPYLEHWLKSRPEDVEYVRTPGVARKWIPHARAFYAFEALGITETVHRAYFDAIHKEGKTLADEASIAQFLAKYGVDESSFRKTYNSFGVRTQVEKARQLNIRYGVASVPTLTVDGKYKTNATMAGSETRLMQLIDYLVAKVRQERKQ
ncbi:MAG: thiol:disulfide interchange protein DsbA/DsbL [Acidiferrobacterales bacterium]